MTKLQQFSHFKIQLISQTMHHGLCSNSGGKLDAPRRGPRFVENLLLAIIIFWWSFTTQRRCYLVRPNSMVIRWGSPLQCRNSGANGCKISLSFLACGDSSGNWTDFRWGRSPSGGDSHQGGGACCAACRWSGHFPTYNTIQFSELPSYRVQRSKCPLGTGLLIRGEHQVTSHRQAEEESDNMNTNGVFHWFSSWCSVTQEIYFWKAVIIFKL